MSAVGAGVLRVDERPAGELRVGELAVATGVSVRNIRAYQDRGLLPPPRRTGRIVWYNAHHVERLGVITSLLERGFSIANIAELLTGWREGGSIADLVGLKQRISGTFSDEMADEDEPAAIIDRYRLDVDDAAAFDQIVEYGLIEVDGDRWRVPSPRLLRAGVELRRVGVPLDVLLTQLRFVRAQVVPVAEAMVALIYRHVWGPHLATGIPPLSEVVEVADVVDHIRPLATTVVTVELATALQAAADRQVRSTIDELAAR